MKDYPANMPFTNSTLSPVALLWIAALVAEINALEERIAALEP